MPDAKTKDPVVRKEPQAPQEPQLFTMFDDIEKSVVRLETSLDELRRLLIPVTAGDDEIISFDPPDTPNNRELSPAEEQALNIYRNILACSRKVKHIKSTLKIVDYNYERK